MHVVKKSYKILVACLILIVILIFLFGILTSPKILYVSVNGNNQNNGESLNNSFRTIQHAVDVAKPNTTIKIYPGVYRESVTINQKTLFTKPLKLVSVKQNNKGATIIGSEPSKNSKWDLCTAETCKNVNEKYASSIYYTSLTWNETPNLLIEHTKNGEHVLNIARSPNFKLNERWKYDENWWTAENTSPSQNILIDTKNLKNIQNLTGATAFIMDGADRCGSMLYSRNIDRYDNLPGELIFNSPVGFSVFDSQETGIGQYTKYFVEGKPELLDAPGEWFYDNQSKKMYVWPLGNANPGKLDIEIARQPFGINIENAENVEINGLVIKNINSYSNYSPGISGSILIKPNKYMRVRKIELTNIQILNSFDGIIIDNLNNKSSVQDIIIKKNDISNIIGYPLFVHNSSDILVSNSKFHHSAHKYQTSSLNFNKVSNVNVLNNHIYNVGFIGVQFISYEKDNEASKNIKVKNNIIENTCEGMSGCAGLKFYGGKYENTIANENIIRNTVGWSYCQSKQKNRGIMGIGLFISNASGVKLTNNVVYKNTYANFFVFPRQIQTYNNQLSGNFLGFSNIGIELANSGNSRDANPTAISTRHDNTVIKNNVFLENKIGIKIDPANLEKVNIDYNTYVSNTTDMQFRNTFLYRLTDIKKLIPFWDTHSIELDKSTYKIPAKYNFSPNN